MTIRTILTWPDERLRDVAAPVTQWDDELNILIEDLFETMYGDGGVGLAAIQIGVGKRVIVVDCGLEVKEPIALINPTIQAAEGETIFAEGCLSVPGIRAEVDRSETITVGYFDAFGDEQTMEADGLLSICIQHEIDHLNGILYFDYLPKFEQRAFLQAYAERPLETDT